MELLNLKILTEILILAFFAVAFLQSGCDKVIDWAGNLGFLQGHFAKSPLKGTVPLLLATLTLFELASGLAAVLGVIAFFIGLPTVGMYALLLCAITILMLFFGQRMAKEYAGAASITGYFIIALIGLATYPV